MIAPYNQNYRFKLELRGRGNGTCGFHTKPGIYSEVVSPEDEFEFNLRGQIQTIRGLTPDWHQPFEFIKKTEGNDWVCHTVGEDSTGNGIISWFGEYYLLCLSYSSNTFWEHNPFSDPTVMMGMASWSQLYGGLCGIQFSVVPPSRKALIDLVLANDESRLRRQAESLNAFIGERGSVMPPDTRHVSYVTIALIIADGCLYHCDFCGVKSGSEFRKRSRGQVNEQISRLKAHYGPDLANLNVDFLSTHDAPGGAPDMILHEIAQNLEAFGIAEKNGTRPHIFLFGSVDSLIRTESWFLDALNELAAATFINVDFELVDDLTLKQINIPLEAPKVASAFEKMLQIIQTCKNIEVFGNSLISAKLPEEHEASLCRRLSLVPSRWPESGRFTCLLSLEKMMTGPVSWTGFAASSPVAGCRYLFI